MTNIVSGLRNCKLDNQHLAYSGYGETRIVGSFFKFPTLACRNRWNSVDSVLWYHSQSQSPFINTASWVEPVIGSIGQVEMESNPAKYGNLPEMDSRQVW